MKNIYVGNLSYQTTEEELRKLFAPYGTVDRVSIPLDSVTGKSRGFAFVEMHDEAAAGEAIQGLNGSELRGRTLLVNKASPRAAEAHTGGGSGERRFGRG
jgi:RNA recognition motif-containing protein